MRGRKNVIFTGYGRTPEHLSQSDVMVHTSIFPEPL
jgi:hypothetical protein